MSSVPFHLPAIVALALLSACGKSPAPQASQPSNSSQSSQVSAEESGDFPLGQEWVRSMIEENDLALTSMREDLDRVRRELDRLATTPESDSTGELKQAMILMLDRQESSLKKLHEQAEEMRKVMAKESR